ncbi:hypothetical protein V8E36_003435 [Tilletia maclaganii]
MDTLNLFSLQPFYYSPTSSPAPSSPPHETFVFVFSQTPPALSGSGFPDAHLTDDPHAHDPYPQDIDSTLTDGEDIDSEAATSTDGSDDGCDLQAFVGSFHSSPPQIPTSLESAAFTSDSER